MPRSFRWAILIAVILGFQVALSAAFDVEEAFHIDNPSAFREARSLPGTGLSPRGEQELWLAQRSAYQSALSGMLPWRPLASVALALAAGAVFVLAMRVRVSPRREAAITLGRAALVTAVLRTIDGAFTLVVARAVTEAATTVLVEQKVPEVEWSAPLLTRAAMASSVVVSFIVVAVFMGLGSYFRSQKLHAQLVERED
ncbi:MAG: hypothetical protein ACOZQL_12710 [Myxococcota bacterium]